MTQFVRITDRVPTNGDLSCNGGDYGFSRIVQVEAGRPVAVQFRTTAEQDFEFCFLCGDFGHAETECLSYPNGTTSAGTVATLVAGWQAGEPISAPRWHPSEYPQYWLRAEGE